MWQNREDISAIINPWLGPFTFRAFLPTPEHKTRELRDVVYDTGFGSGFGSVHSGATRMATQLRLIAYDPVWYGKARTNTEAPGTGSTLAFEFPLNPGLGGERDFDTIEFGGGTSFAARTFNIYYNGTWPAYPVVQILGPADDPILTNNTTGEKLEFDGYNVAAGEVVTIDTRFGFKTVESDINGNIVGYLTTDTDLATFHLEIDPVAAGGLNSFTYSALNTDSDSRLTVRWTDRWVAI